LKSPQDFRVLVGSSYSSWAASQPGDYQVVSASKSRIGRPCAWNSSSSLASPEFSVIERFHCFLIISLLSYL
jgi:hypothetical protein